MTPGRARLLVSCVVAVGLAVFALAVVLDVWLVRLGYDAQLETVFDPVVWPLVAAFLAAGAVGAVVAVQQPANPVGWLFLGLAGAVIVSATVDQWYSFALVVEPARIGGGDVAGLVGDKSFIPWFTLVTFILLLTPTGTYLSARWRVVGQFTLAAGSPPSPCRRCAKESSTSTRSPRTR